MNVRLLTTTARIPQKATPGASGYDLCSDCSDVIQPGQRKRIPLGFALAISEGYEMQIRPRSGLSLRGIDVCLGTIDSDYRGEVSAILVNNGAAAFSVKQGDRIAQGVFVQLAEVGFMRVERLDETERGVGGFGSTGVYVERADKAAEVAIPDGDGIIVEEWLPFEPEAGKHMPDCYQWRRPGLSWSGDYDGRKDPPMRAREITELKGYGYEYRMKNPAWKQA